MLPRRSAADQKAAGALLADRATAVRDRLAEQDAAWCNQKWTRRTFLAGAGMVGVAALGSQLVTARAAYAATPSASNGNTLITIFMRGAADGLRILTPNSSDLGLDYLQSVRPKLIPTSLIPLTGGWALNGALSPLAPFWNSRELAFVPGVSTGGISRSHFQAQAYLERGSDTSTTGWLDRALSQLGPGTTFRAVADGGNLPLSLSGPQSKLIIDELKNFTFPGWDGVTAQAEAAISTMYRGLSGPLGEDVPTTLAALATAGAAQAKAGVQNGAVYPSGNFSDALKDLATLLRAEVGMQVATIDVGGWDTHTDEVNQLDKNLTAMAKSLAAFLTDLGTVRRQRVTIAVVTEFGRRIEMNGSGGTDHGHGSVVWLLGGGIVPAQVHGKWTKLSAGSLDQGDVPACNDVFDVLGELAQKRLGVGSLTELFPGHSYQPLGLATAAASAPTQVRTPGGTPLPIGRPRPRPKPH